MNNNTWNSLTKVEQEEVKNLSSDFIKEVMNSNAADGLDFCEKYDIRLDEEFFFIFEKSTGEKFKITKSKSEKVMNALFESAVQNYGR